MYGFRMVIIQVIDCYLSLVGFVSVFVDSIVIFVYDFE